jgi:hypothetical protein
MLLFLLISCLAVPCSLGKDSSSLYQTASEHRDPGIVASALDQFITNSKDVPLSDSSDSSPLFAGSLPVLRAKYRFDKNEERKITPSAIGWFHESIYEDNLCVGRRVAHNGYRLRTCIPFSSASSIYVTCTQSKGSILSLYLYSVFPFVSLSSRFICLFPGSGTVFFNLYKSTNCASATKSNTLFAPLNVCLDSSSYKLFDDDAPADTTTAAVAAVSSSSSGNTREQVKGAREQEEDVAELISLLASVSYTTAVLTCCEDCEIPTPTDDNGAWATR